MKQSKKVARFLQKQKEKADDGSQSKRIWLKIWPNLNIGNSHTPTTKKSLKK